MNEGENKLWDAACAACEDVISTPVCPECVAEQLADSIGRQDPAVAMEIRDYAKTIHKTGDELSSCILCGSKIPVCAYCFIGELIEGFKNRCPNIVEACVDHFGYGEVSDVS